MSRRVRGIIGSLRWRRAALARRLADRAAGTHWRVEGGDRSVAITFDDGPDPEFTPAVIDILERHNALATFFLVGSRARRHPELVRRLAAAGHQIGSHSETHADMWEIGWRGVAREYRDGRQVLEEIVGAPVPLFRPPKGYLDLPRAMIGRALGLRLWLWTREGEDWAPDATPAGIVERVGVPEPGDVVLLHDAIERPVEERCRDRSATLAALDTLLTDLSQRGFTFVTLG
jgi:peptidoglycan/xylan/chitin deacetylase (PgdA/CDA1 family)